MAKASSGDADSTGSTDSGAKSSKRMVRKGIRRSGRTKEAAVLGESDAATKTAAKAGSETAEPKTPSKRTSKAAADKAASAESVAASADGKEPKPKRTRTRKPKAGVESAGEASIPKALQVIKPATKAATEAANRFQVISHLLSGLVRGPVL
jgi:hypothetical protein